MNKGKPSRDKRSLVTVLSLGFTVLGIGCIFWAMFGLWTQSAYSTDSKRSQDPILTTIVAEQNKLTGDSATLVEPGYSYTNTRSDGDTVEDTNVESDPSPALPAPDKILYPVYPVEGDNIGSLTIPDLKLKLPIIQGTGAKELKKGVGHFIPSVLPGEKDNCVFSGHRETVFAKLGKLKVGDQLIVQTSAGTFTYEVSGARIVHADDKTVIVPTDDAVLTMTTCYPFNTPGYFPDRYIVSADLVESK